MINSKLQREKVHLSRLGKDVFVNPISIADDEWMGEQWDPATLQAAFTDVNVDILFAIFWRILDDEGKRLIAKASIVNWDGLREVPVEPTDDPVQKLKQVVSGGKEIIEIMTAIYETRRKSNPEPAKNEKKSLKAGSSSRTPSSMISSPASTDSTAKSSEDTHAESSPT